MSSAEANRPRNRPPRAISSVFQLRLKRPRAWVTLFTMSVKWLRTFSPPSDPFASVSFGGAPSPRRYDPGPVRLLDDHFGHGAHDPRIKNMPHGQRRGFVDQHRLLALKSAFDRDDVRTRSWSVAPRRSSSSMDERALLAARGSLLRLPHRRAARFASPLLGVRRPALPPGTTQTGQVQPPWTCHARSHRFPGNRPYSRSLPPG